MAGADYLCYVTPTEHIALPDLEDVREGVIVAKITAHAADLARRRRNSLSWDYSISKSRADLNWEEQIRLAINPDKVRKIRELRHPKKIEEVCTMCGEFCAIKLLKEYTRAEH
jgi:phosphomethylpyrimidine synthase